MAGQSCISKIQQTIPDTCIKLREGSDPTNEKPMATCMVRGSRIPYTRWGGKTAKSRGRDLCYATKHCRVQGERRTAPGPQATLTPHVPAPADQKALCAWLIEVMHRPSSLYGTHQFSPIPFTFTSATIQTVAFVPPVTARALHTMSKCVILVSTQYQARNNDFYQ